MGVTKYRRRLPHILIPGQAYFLTFRLSRAQAGLSAEEKTAVGDHVRRMTPGKLMAWVVMPDHVHILYLSAKDEDLRKTLKALKGASARTLSKSFGRTVPLWQEETFDRIVRNEEELHATWIYLEHNPVRKGLAERAEEYPWCSAVQRRAGR